MTVHAARVGSSERLQRVLAVLGDHREHSTFDIVVNAAVCAVNSIVAELRYNGHRITCRQDRDPQGNRIWLYRLERGKDSC